MRRGSTQALARRRMRTIKRISGRAFRFGGEEHSGWLPPGAVTPPPTPIKDATLDLAILFDGHGFILEYSSRDAHHYGDTWHETLEDALRQAQLSFGIDPSEWEDPAS